MNSLALDANPSAALTSSMALQAAKTTALPADSPPSASSPTGLREVTPKLSEHDDADMLGDLTAGLDAEVSEVLASLPVEIGAGAAGVAKPPKMKKTVVPSLANTAGVRVVLEGMTGLSGSIGKHLSAPVSGVLRKLGARMGTNLPPSAIKILKWYIGTAHFSTIVVPEDLQLVKCGEITEAMKGIFAQLGKVASPSIAEPVELIQNGINLCNQIFWFMSNVAPCLRVPSSVTAIPPKKPRVLKGAGSKGGNTINAGSAERIMAQQQASAVLQQIDMGPNKRQRAAKRSRSADEPAAE